MKRLIGVLTASVASVASLVVFAGPALADCGTGYPPPTCEPPTVLGRTVHNGGTAFTGSNISLGLILLVVLVVLGASALLMARRRAAARG